MKSRDERARNLLSRLFAYAPRKCREALEDYCTEARPERGGPTHVRGSEELDFIINYRLGCESEEEAG